MIYALKYHTEGSKQSQESPKKDQKIQIYAPMPKPSPKDFYLCKMGIHIVPLSVGCVSPSILRSGKFFASSH